MKTIVIAALVAAASLPLTLDFASAQSTNGAGQASTNGNAGNSGRSAERSTPERGGLDASPARLNCVPGAAARGCNPPPRRKVMKLVVKDGCECNTRKVRVGSGITYVMDCYYYDPNRNAQRYCEPWERSGRR